MHLDDFWEIPEFYSKFAIYINNSLLKLTIMNQNSKIFLSTLIFSLTFFTFNLSCKKKNPAKVDPAKDVKIGDSFEGGIVAYILQPGEIGYDANFKHGIIAAPTNQSVGIKWENGIYMRTGTIETAIGKGNSNTSTIVKSQGNGSYAAKLCSDLTLGGYSDWYLPSRDELNELFKSRILIGGFTTEFYWSSSENDIENAFAVDFGTGTPVFHGKTNIEYVRAVRSF